MENHQNQGAGPKVAVDFEADDDFSAVSTTNPTIGMEEGEDDIRAQIYRGNLLELSQFLTMFGSYYSWNGFQNLLSNVVRGSNLSGKWAEHIITPRDIELALKFRYALEKKQALLDEQCALEVSDSQSKTEREHVLQQLIQEQENRLSDQSNRRGEQLHRLLQRFEVWSTKDVAHTLFMPPCNCSSIDEAKTSCFSKLLQLPGAAYFSDRLRNPGLNVNERGVKDVGKSGLETGLESGLLAEQRDQIHASKVMVSTADFSEVYKKVHNESAKHPMCSLIMPPNVHTWEEYARIARVVAMLPTEEARKAAGDSPCSGANETKESIKQSTNAFAATAAAKLANEKRIYAVDYTFEPHDLVALWVRSQRNSSCLRHLIQLFTCRKWISTIDNNENHTCNGKKGTFQLKFVGNSKYTKRRVLTESPMVEQLRQWAVLNHVYGFMPFFRDYLDARDKKGALKAKKRAMIGSSPPSRKRLRAEQGFVAGDAITKDPDIILLEDCYRFMLRWFCRRNQEKVAILYYTNISHFPPIGASCYNKEEVEAFFEQCVKAKITIAIKDRLKVVKNETETNYQTERSFSRLEKKIRRGNYAPGDTMKGDGRKTPFYLAVSTLLRAWSECLAEESSIDVSALELKSVLDDFDEIHDWFCALLNEEGVHAAAAALLDLDTSGTPGEPRVSIMNGEATKQLLLGIPPPWNELCEGCKSSLWSRPPHSKQNGLVCASCERSYNEDCFDVSHFRRINIEEMVGKMKEQIRNHEQVDEGLMPLATFSVDVLETESAPDFLGSNAGKIRWTAMTITLRRAVDENGKMEGSGVKFRQIEACNAAFEYVRSGNLTFRELFMDDLEEQTPVGFADDVNGSLVVDVKEGQPYYRAGVKVNDVVAGIEFVSSCHTSATAHRPAGVQEFAGLTKQDRLELLKMPCEEVKLAILRPDLDIVSKIKEWCNEIRRSNQPLLNLSKESFLVCNESNCQLSQVKTSEQKSIRREALHCRAIIRRMGMESYSLGFRGEGSENPDFVSLRRLDAMMSWFLQSTSITEKKLLRHSFFLPAWSSPKRERLEWAPPEFDLSPTNLFLSGMGILLCRKKQANNLQAETSPASEHQRLAMLRHFIRLFFCWGQGKTVPPPAALRARQPWLSNSCVACFARTGERMHCGYHVCSSWQCLRLVEVVSSNMASYGRYSNLVGMSILVFENDSLLVQVRNDSELRIDSAGRPVEFLVAMYNPVQKGEKTKEHGMFYLLPIVGERQLRYLLDGLTIFGETGSRPTIEYLDKWIEKSILGLPGVVKIQTTALLKKIKDTSLFLKQVEARIGAIAQQNKVTIENHQFPFDVIASNRGSEYMSKRARQGTEVLRTLLYSPSPAVRRMIQDMDRTRCLHAMTCNLRTETEVQPFDEFPSSHISSWSGREKLEVEGEGFGNGADFSPNDNIAMIEERFSKPKSIDSYSLFYTDLYGVSDEDYKRLEETLASQDIVPLPLAFRLSPSETIVLSRPEKVHGSSDNRDEYQGFGWGFELLWKRDGHIQVGRVHPRSPAARAGLKTHDYILAINGRAGGHGNPWTRSFFVSSILASPLRTSLKAKNIYKISATVLGHFQSPAKGPVVITIQRTVAIATDQFDPTNHFETIPYRSTQRRDAAAPTLAAATNAPQISVNPQLTTEFQNEKSALSANSVVQLPPLPETSNETATIREMQIAYVGEACVVALEQLSLHLRRLPLQKQRPIDASDCYAACESPGSIVTKIEASTLLKAVKENMPMLGLRLLCPRYKLAVVIQQVIVLGANPEYLQKVPMLQKSLWKEFLIYDYKRTLKEPKDAPILFVDGEKLAFPMPSVKLPLDRLVEGVFRQSLNQQLQQNAQQQRDSHPRYQQQQEAADDLVHHNQQQLMHPAMHRMSFHPVQARHSDRHLTLSVPPPPAFHLPQHDNRHYPHAHVAFVDLEPIGKTRDDGGLLHTNPNGDSPIERIRGGGVESRATLVATGENDSEESDYEIQWGIQEKGDSIVDQGLPVAEWDNALVTFVEESDAHGCLGYIQMPENSIQSVVDLNDVPVAIFYSDKKGVFAEPTILNYDPFDLVAVPKDSSLARQAERIESQFGVLSKLLANKTTTASTPEETSARQEGQLRAEEVQLGTVAMQQAAQRDSSPQGLQNDTKKISKYAEITAKLVHSLVGQAGGSAVPFGTLVDGRQILWYPSDPVCVYIEHFSERQSSESVSGVVLLHTIYRQNEQRKSRDRLVVSRDAVHCCVWGCTFEPVDGEIGLEIAHFTSPSHLLEHYARFHAFHGDAKTSVWLGSNSRFSRVANISGIKQLIAGLSSAIGARSVLVAEQATKTAAFAELDPSGEKIVCSPSRHYLHFSLDYLVAAKGAEITDLSKKQKLQAEDQVREGLMLLLKISLLFDLDATFLKLTAGASEALSQFVASNCPGDQSLTGLARCCTEVQKSTTVTRRECLLCPVCSLDAEEVFQAQSRDEHKKMAFHGIGCAIVAGPKTKNDTTVIGGLCYSKEILLQSPEKIPVKMQLQGAPVGSRDVLGRLKGKMWTAYGYRQFQLFAKEQTSVRGLAQSFVMLTASFDTTRLPLWWRAGWSSGASSLLLSPTTTRASLLFHLLLFDNALAEFLEHATTATPLQFLDITGISSPPFVAGLTIEEKTNLLLKSAIEMKIPRFTGVHEGYCSICDDGGDLLCCEFCPAVVHPTCCNPPVPIHLEHFCCVSCTASLMELCFQAPFEN